MHGWMTGNMNGWMGESVGEGRDGRVDGWWDE